MSVHPCVHVHTDNPFQRNLALEDEGVILVSSRFVEEKSKSEFDGETKRLREGAFALK